jgi:hypothetical protein
MIQAILPSLLGLIGKAVDKAVPDKDKAEQLKAEITLQAMQQDNAELQGAIQIITAEAQGDSWLQRNWRPLLMLWFAGLVGAHWLGFTPPNLPENVVVNLLDIVQVGVGGYVLGRSGEKMVKAYKGK